MTNRFIDAGGDPHSNRCLLSVFQLTEGGGYKTLFVRFGMSYDEMMRLRADLQQGMAPLPGGVVLVPDKHISK